MMLNRTILLLTLILGVWSLPAVAATGMAIDPKTCLECHDDSVAGHDFANSVHGQNACTSCHVEVIDLDAHLEGEIAVQPVNCVRCHKEVGAAHAGSVHQANDIDCTACHTDIHRQQAWHNDKATVVATCQNCHDIESYETSVHGQAVAAGNADAAACHDCHHLHQIQAIREDGRAFGTESCIGCHEDEAVMERNDVAPHAVETYLESYHGKSYRLGFPERAAGCSDCHTAHGVLGKNDPASSLHGDNLVARCAACHPQASHQFAKFYAHGDHGDRENYPLLYWTFLAMTGLLIGTFAVFWVHTLLWMFRGFVENRERQRLRAAGHEEHIPNAHKQYLRFQKRHIFLHLTVIISFLGLSLTGLPLKFADQEWAKTMMSFYGGVYYAGLIHRGCAILTFYYFLSTFIMIFDFLFVRKDVQGSFFVRLFGPDSLMPNFRDIRDVKNMLNWFLFRGPKPTFERWTYWEKFDFIAVFWGMFAIGGSGLLLWFPEFFGTLLPGWMFNVATIIHSDEALLATGFIFTVHFFNTHGRPEKFPMDFVIFNGQLSKEEFIEERGDQWKRYEALGSTEEFAAKKTSGVLYDFLFKGFGFVAVFTGLSLTVLMLVAFLKG